MGRPKSSESSPSSGWKAFGGRISPELAKAVRIYSVEADISVQDIMSEALRDYLIKHGKKPPKE